MGARAVHAAQVSSLRPGDSVRVIAVRGSGPDAERASVWLEIIERVDAVTVLAKPELYARTLTDGQWSYRDRIRVGSQHVADVRTASSLRSVDRKTFERPKARMH
jgi:hypothetical protein